MSRSREVYALAANFLQTTPAARASPEAAARVAAFYEKAGAHASLAAFHEARARDALEAAPGARAGADYAAVARELEAAARAAARAAATAAPGGDSGDGGGGWDVRAADLAACARDAAAFVEARATLRTDPAAAVATCQRLLAAAGLGGGGAGEISESAAAAAASAPRVRPGDVLAALVEWCAAEGNAAQALQLLHQMAARGLEPARFLEPALVRGVYETNGEAPPAVAALVAVSEAGAAWQQGQVQQQQLHQRETGEEGELPEDVPFMGDCEAAMAVEEEAAV